MDTDDLEPRKRPAVQTTLDGMSVAELQEYIAGLETEIARARDAIGRKQSHRSAVESFFKS